MACTIEDTEMANEMDKALERQGLRLIKMSTIVKRNPQLLIKHIRRVLERTTREEYRKYAAEVRQIAKSLQEEYWKQLNEELKRSPKGVRVYLAQKLNEMDFFALAEMAGIKPSIIDKLIQQRAKEIYPPRKRNQEPQGYTHIPPELYNAPNDLIAKRFQTATDWEWQYGEITVVEQRANKRKRLPYIESTMKLGIDELRALGHSNITRLEGYAIFTAIASQMAGNQADSIDTLYRAMGGKGKAPDDIREAMRLGIIKGMSTPITIDAKGICKWQGYKGKDNYVIDNILSVKIVKRGILNGGDVEDLIVYKDESPLVKVARAKGNQFITYDSALLDVPFRKNANNILIPPYLLQHIEDSVHSRKRLEQSIIIDTAISTLEYKGDRTRFVNYVLRCFEHWKSTGYIKTYSAEKNGWGKVEKVRYTKPSKRLPGK